MQEFCSMGRLLDEGVNIIWSLGVCGEKVIIVEEQNDGAVIGSHFNICSHLHIEHPPITSMSVLWVTFKSLFVLFQMGLLVMRGNSKEQRIIWLRVYLNGCRASVRKIYSSHICWRRVHWSLDPRTWIQTIHHLYIILLIIGEGHLRNLPLF